MHLQKHYIILENTLSPNKITMYVVRPNRSHVVKVFFFHLNKHETECLALGTLCMPKARRGWLICIPHINNKHFKVLLENIKAFKTRESIINLTELRKIIERIKSERCFYNRPDPSRWSSRSGLYRSMCYGLFLQTSREKNLGMTFEGCFKFAEQIGAVTKGRFFFQIRLLKAFSTLHDLERQVHTFISSTLDS